MIVPWFIIPAFARLLNIHNTFMQRQRSPWECKCWLQYFDDVTLKKLKVSKQPELQHCTDQFTEGKKTQTFLEQAEPFHHGRIETQNNYKGCKAFKVHS